MARLKYVVIKIILEDIARVYSLPCTFSISGVKWGREMSSYLANTTIEWLLRCPLASFWSCVATSSQNGLLSTAHVTERKRKKERRKLSNQSLRQNNTFVLCTHQVDI